MYVYQRVHGLVSKHNGFMVNRNQHQNNWSKPRLLGVVKIQSNCKYLQMDICKSRFDDAFNVHKISSDQVFIG